MKTRAHILLSLILAGSLAALPIYAAEPSGHEPQTVTVEFAAQPLPLTDDEAKALIESAHEIIEGDESGAFFTRWKNAFDFKSRFIDAFRWSSATQDPRFKNLVLDSLVLFGMSHTLEMSSGPILLGVGTAHQWPDWLMGAIAGGGVVISIPGLDPLCIVIFASYAGSRKFRDTVGFVRLAAVHGAKYALTKTHADLFLKRLFARQDARPWLEQLPGLKRADVQEDKTIRFVYEPAVGVELTVELRGEEAWLTGVVIQNVSEEARAASSNFLRALGWNARDLVKQAFHRSKYEVLTRKPYVTNASVTESSREFNLTPGAVRIKLPRQGLFTRKSCEAAAS